MELRYKLNGDHFEKDVPDTSLKINEVLFLKYFESDVDTRMKKYDGVVAAFKFPLRIVERFLRVLLFSFYVCLGLVLLHLYFSVPATSPYSAQQMAKDTQFAKPVGLIQSIFAPRPTRSLLECAMGRKNAIWCQPPTHDQEKANLDADPQASKRLLAHAHPDTQSTPQETPAQQNPATFTINDVRLSIGGQVFGLAEQTTMTYRPWFLRLAFWLAGITFVASVLLSHVLKYVRGKVDAKIGMNFDMMMAEENQSQTLYSFYSFGDYSKVRVKVNSTSYPVMEPDNDKKNSYFGTDGGLRDKKNKKENIECVNRNGYQIIPFEPEE